MMMMMQLLRTRKKRMNNSDIDLLFIFIPVRTHNAQYTTLLSCKTLFLAQMVVSIMVMRDYIEWLSAQMANTLHCVIFRVHVMTSL